MTNQNTNVPKNIVGKYHLEISQSVQNEENSIPLLRDKKTYARAYIDHGSITELKKGVYRAQFRLTSPAITFNSLNSLTLDSKNPVSYDRQRSNWERSFNFDFDPDWASLPNEIFIDSLELISIAKDQTYKLETDDDPIKFKVENSPGLKITCLLLRYWNADTEDYVMPDPVQVDAIRDFVVSAFPVAKNSVKWKTITVQATNEFRSLDKLTKPRPNLEEVTSMAMRELLLQTTVHRNMDIYTSADWQNTHNIRTMYLAVFDDPSGRLGGAATDSPNFPTHNIAGASVVDMSGLVGAHELAHMLGREHPGVPWRGKYGPYLGQRMEDEKFDENYTGFLNVDYKKTFGLHISPQFKTPKIYEPNLYFDLMTYREPQWLSDYSYLGIKERLIDLYKKNNAVDYKGTAKTWVVIGEYDLNRQTGRILFVLPTSYKGLDLQLREYKKNNGKDDSKMPAELKAYKNSTSDLKIKLISINTKNKRISPPIDVYHRLPDDGGAAKGKRRDMPNFGIFQCTIDIRDLSKIRLKVAGNIVDVFERNPRKQPAYSKQLPDLVKCLNKAKEEPVPRMIRIEHPLRYMKANSNQSLLFYYDVIEDEYFLRFNWMAKPEKLNPKSRKVEDKEIIESCKKFPDSKIISTIQCKRPKKKPSDLDEWITVMVSSRRRGKTWISSDLVAVLQGEYKNDPEYGNDLKFSENPFFPHLSKKSRSLLDLSTDKIEIRVLFSAGFFSEKFIANPLNAKIHFPTEFLQNEQDRKNKLNYLNERKAKLKDPPLKELQNRSGKHRPMY